METTSFMAQFREWLRETLSVIRQQVRSGKYTQEYCESSIKPVLEAIREGRPFQVVLSGPALTDKVGLQLAAWQTLYKKRFGADSDFLSLVVPKSRSDFGQLIVVRGLAIEQAFQQCCECFHCRKYTYRMLDNIISSNDRKPKGGAYAIWVRNRIEADKEHRKCSAQYLFQEHIPGITLLERLLLEMKYFRDTEQHLDVENITLCSGSRYEDGGVPGVRWHKGNMEILRLAPDFADEHLRCREVVSQSCSEI